jgi:flagellar hook-associated protein 2
VEKINGKAGLATAAVSKQGNGSRLQFVSHQGGADGRIAVSSADLGLTFRTTQRGQDGLLAVGDSANGGNPQIHRSQDGVFTTAIAGLAITATSVTESAAKITVAHDNEAVVTAVNQIVDQYNKIHALVEQLTFFDAETNSTGLLFGSGEVLKVSQGLSRTITSPYAVSGSLKSLQSIGVSFDQQGKLSLSASKLRQQLETRPDDVKELLSNETRGFQNRLDTVTEQLAGVNNSTLISKNESLSKLIDSSNARIDTLNLRLEGERNRLLSQFFAMETAISRIQANQSAINSISSAAALSSFFTSRQS